MSEVKTFPGSPLNETPKTCIGSDTITEEKVRQFVDHVDYEKEVKTFNVYSDGTRELKYVTVEKNSTRDVVLEERIKEIPDGEQS